MQFGLGFGFGLGIGRAHVDGAVDGRRTEQHRRGAFEYLHLRHVFHRNQVPRRTSGIGAQNRHFVQQHAHAATHTGTEAAAAAHLRFVVHDGQAGHVAQGFVERRRVFLFQFLKSDHFQGLNRRFGVGRIACAHHLDGTEFRGLHAERDGNFLLGFAGFEADLLALYIVADIVVNQRYLGLGDRQRVTAVEVGYGTDAGFAVYHDMGLRQRLFVGGVRHDTGNRIGLLGLCGGKAEYAKQ